MYEPGAAEHSRPSRRLSGVGRHVAEVVDDARVIDDRFPVLATTDLKRALVTNDDEAFPGAADSNIETIGVLEKADGLFGVRADAREYDDVRLGTLRLGSGAARADVAESASLVEAFEKTIEIQVRGAPSGSLRESRAARPRSKSLSDSRRAVAPKPLGGSLYETSNDAGASGGPAPVRGRGLEDAPDAADVRVGRGPRRVEERVVREGLEEPAGHAVVVAEKRVREERVERARGAQPVA